MPVHTEFMHDVMTDDDYAKEYEVAVQDRGNGVLVAYPDHYRPDMDEIAYNAMNQEFGTLTHVCVELNCSKPTLLKWIKRHPSLRAAIEAGRQRGEVMFRKKLADNAFQPTTNVNNGLIKLLAKNVHGIDDVGPKGGPSVNIYNNNNNQTIVAEKESAQLYKDAIEIECKSEDDDGWGEDDD